MSMQAALFGDYPIPDDTYRLAHAVFPNGNLYLQLRDRYGMLFDNQRFAHLFSAEGQPALAPARLALVTLFQFMDRLTDRQAADHVRDRISWKYALGLPLDEPGFHYSVLSEFRNRLLHGDAEHLLLDAVLDLGREEGWLKGRMKHRTDATHGLAAIRELHRLELVSETLRHALNALAVVAPGWLRAHADRAWVERDAKRLEQYRLPQAEGERQLLSITIGQDGYHLLEVVYDPAMPRTLREVAAVETLRQVWVQQYYRSTDPAAPVLRLRITGEVPPAGQIISSPYDPEARYKTKGETSWVGYTVHLTETCEDDTPNLITHVATTPASLPEGAMIAEIQADLVAKDLAPSEHSMDRGYVDAGLLVDSQRERGITVVGPVIEVPAWQAQTPGGLTAAQFVIDWEAQRVVCPEGKSSPTWHPTTDVQGNEVIMVRFRRSDCQGCVRRKVCTKAETAGRTLTLRPREEHRALQEARAWQETAEFKAKYARRAGVEGTFHQANSRCDLRQARYVGLAKTHLQEVITAVAINLVRMIAWLAEVPRAATRTSSFAKLMAVRC